MKERGIIMGAPMVRALLDGSKTQTRRVVDVRKFGANETHGSIGGFIRNNELWRAQAGKFNSFFPWPGLSCPYGVAGDRLWVRETFTRYTFRKQPIRIVYRADNELHGHKGWTPSIHMPRWASRITLEITRVRVERLQDITTRDVQAEGFPYDGPQPEGARIRWYRGLWDSLHGKGAWELNPWVWVLEFKRV